MTAPRVRQLKLLNAARPSRARNASTLAEPGIVDQIFDTAAVPVTPELERLLAELNQIWPQGARSGTGQARLTEDGHLYPRNLSGDLSDAPQQSGAPTRISDYRGGAIFDAVASATARSQWDERPAVSEVAPELSWSPLAKLASALDGVEALYPTAALSHSDERLARSELARELSWSRLVKLAPASGESEIGAVRPYRILRLVVVLLLAGSCIGGLLVWPRPNKDGWVDNPAVAVTAEQPTGPLSKISDRLEPSQSQMPVTPLDMPVPVAVGAEPVTLYEEDPTTPAGKRFVGSAIWRTHVVPMGAGRAPELEIRADVEIPERNLTLTWWLRREIDQALPARYAVEMMFTPLPNAPSGGPSDVLGLAMKQSEQIRGVQIRGPIVKVTDGLFRIDLSSSASNRKSNMQLLKESPLFDIPMVYINNRRAILALSKGVAGERVFDEVYRAWGND
jgi:hypothetical protein